MSNSVMNFDMSRAPTMSAPRASFDRSHGHSTTIDFDYIYPIYHDEVYPGDTFNMNPEVFARLATPLHPLMDNMYLDIHFFYVPMRQLWVNSKKFFGEQDNPGDSIDYSIPQITATATTGYAELSLPDYLGLPTKVPDYTWNALYARCYQHCYNEWYRDQNLIDSVTISTADGPDTTTSLSLQKRGKRFDYFTSGLVSPQKQTSGAVDLPLGTSARIAHDATATTSALSVWSTSLNDYDQMDLNGSSKLSPDYAGSAVAGNKLYADLSTATAATVIELRQAEKIQELLELDARAGTRYAEIVYSVYGVTMIDLTYRPEFLGGGSTPIGIQKVAQTSNDATNGSVGQLAGFGEAYLKDGGFTKSFTEHGIVMGMVSARADLRYSQGLLRQMKRLTRYDYLYPILQNIGDQATYTDEIYCQNPTTDTGSTGTPDNERVFNYQERYAELKYKPSTISGLFRPNATSSLESWHLSEEFTTVPTFNQTFIEQNTPMDRAIVTASEPHLILDCYFDLKCARPMQMYSIPGMGARF